MQVATTTSLETQKSVLMQEAVSMNILSFDIEDWFHILDNKSTKGPKEWMQFPSRVHEGTDRILNLCQEKNVKATFFVLGWIAEKYPEVVKKISDLGYEIGCHSHYHQLLYDLNKNEFSEDTKRAISTIENVTGKKIRSYRTPGFSLTEQTKFAFDVLVENGIEVDSSIFSLRIGHGGFANFHSSNPCLISYNGYSLKEFPMNIETVMGKKLIFSGGGYFRFFPYWFISSLIKKNDYVMTYFHPRDFDANQPLIPDMKFHRRWKSYYGLKGSLDKLRRMIDDHQFNDMQSVEKAIDWSKVEVVKI